MLLSDIFSIPFLICLAICVLLIGCSSIYFYQRIMQQDHKIASMVSLISSMAEEPPASISCVTQSCPLPPPTIQKRIAVSDDEDSESSSCESSECTSGSDYDDNSDYSETSSENDGDEHILSAVDFDDLPTDLEKEDLIEDEILIGASVEPLMEESQCETLVNDPPPADTTKSIHLDADVTDFSIFKSINISDDHQHPEETSYKKMSLQKLREIAQQNGHSDVSKLKKHELLKLLEAE